MSSYKSLNSLLYELIDYAGLFPPADLDMQASIKNYNEIVKSDKNWMISQFIVPISRLDEMTSELLTHFDKQNPLFLSLISPDFKNQLSKLKHFLTTSKDIVVFKGLEMVALDLDSLSNSLSNTYSILDKESDFEPLVFYELKDSKNWNAEIDKFTHSIADFNKVHNVRFGFKLRCGGVKSTMFPSCENIAKSIISCRNQRIPMKFTAGLHHPIRHYDNVIKTKMNGFLNIFIGGMIAHKFKIGIDKLVEILTDENSSNFIFKDNEIVWNSYSVTNSEVKYYRDKYFISYGSCSFKEPVDDLQNLGLL